MRRVTCGVACLGTERQDFDIFVIGACSQQLPTVAPGHTVDGPLVVFVPLEADDRLLDWTWSTEERKRGEEETERRQRLWENINICAFAHIWWGVCTEPKQKNHPVAPCCRLARDTEVSADVPPDWRSAFDLKLWDFLTYPSHLNVKIVLFSLPHY